MLLSVNSSQMALIFRNQVWKEGILKKTPKLKNCMTNPPLHLVSIQLLGAQQGWAASGHTCTAAAAYTASKLPW